MAISIGSSARFREVRFRVLKGQATDVEADFIRLVDLVPAESGRSLVRTVARVRIARPE